jgi:hypothetical protein
MASLSPTSHGQSFGTILANSVIDPQRLADFDKHRRIIGQFIDETMNLLLNRHVASLTRPHISSQPRCATQKVIGSPRTSRQSSPATATSIKAWASWPLPGAGLSRSSIEPPSASLDKNSPYPALLVERPTGKLGQVPAPVSSLTQSPSWRTPGNLSRPSTLSGTSKASLLPQPLTPPPALDAPQIRFRRLRLHLANGGGHLHKKMDCWAFGHEGKKWTLCRSAETE